jgi:hypothetical protein
MSDTKAKSGTRESFQRAGLLLLAVCAILLAVNAALMFLYLSTAGEIARALSAIREQQAATNTRLDVVRGELDSNLNAIRDELHALNEKAAGTADVTPPGNDSAQN